MPGSMHVRVIVKQCCFKAQQEAFACYRHSSTTGYL